MQNKQKQKNDIILIIALTFLSVLSIFLIKSFSTEGKYAAVSVNGREIQRYSLDRDREVPVYTGKNRSGLNILVIKDGKAFVKDANCPDRICVSHKAISKVGETVVCLPHRLVISIESEKESAIDAEA